jgi:hypothetical protein
MANGTPREQGDWNAKWQELHNAMGIAIAAWSTLEHALARAFAVTLGLPAHRTERMFFAMHTFSAKHDLLWEAIQSNPLPPGIEATRQSIFKSACKKAERYAPTRNKLAHSTPAIVSNGSLVLGGVIMPNVVNEDANVTLTQTLTVKAILESSDSFRALARILTSACDEGSQASLETLLVQVRALAPCPYSDSLGIRVASTQGLPPEPCPA